MKILWVNISYYPAPGGAAIDLKMIGEELEKINEVERICVLAEAYPGQPDKECGHNGKLEVLRMFPFRGGADKKSYQAYLKYGMQNIKLLTVPSLAKKMNADVVVFHSWYFINPSVIPHVVKQLKKQGVKLIADMRDTFLRQDQFSRLYAFDALLCCGLRVVDHFKVDSVLKNKLHYVPVPHVPVEISNEQIKVILSQFKLTDNRFIFSPSGVNDLKRFPLIFDAWKILLDRGVKLDLVVAGRTRDWRKQYDITHANGQLICTGSLDKNGIHTLYKSAALSLNPSNAFFEGLPRVPLEALHHGKPLLFPPNIAEFDAAFPADYICNTNDPSELAEQMESAISRARLGVDYDISRHSPQTIARDILEVFRSTFR